MPTFTGKAISTFYKRILQVGQSSNTGVENSTVTIQDGEGVASSTSLGKAGLNVKPTSSALDAAGTFNVQTSGGDQIFQANTNDSTAKAGASLANVLTMHKSMGLYDFTPAQGYHYPLVANTMHFETAFAADNDWGNGADPATTLDVSGLTAQENAVAVYWFIQHNITLDAVRYLITSDGTATCNMHLLSYSIDTSSGYGDLSSGTVCASGSAPATATGIKTSTLSLDSANIDSGKVVVGFIENASDTSDVSVALDIYYHIR